MAKFHTETEWKNAKKLFETETGKKRPKKAFMVFWKKGSGIEPALKACDALGNNLATNAKDMRAGTEKLRKVVDAYMKQLDDIIKAEGTTDDGTDIKSDLYRHTKLLKATALKFVEQFEFEAQNFEVLENSKNQANVATATADANLKKALSFCAVAIQAVKADPTAETYNKHFGESTAEVGRKLATSLKAYMGTNPDWDVQKHIDSLKEFSTGKNMTVKLSTSSEDVLKLLKEFSTKVKAVKADSGF